MKNTSLKSKVAKGFSLVEMLVVIAVIGVIAAIAIPNIGTITGAAGTAKNKRNAQTVVATHAAGAAAGVVWTGTTPAEVIADVITGDFGAGEFSTNRFEASGIVAGDVDDYITGTASQLIYTP